METPEARSQEHRLAAVVVTGVASAAEQPAGQPPRDAGRRIAEEIADLAQIDFEAVVDIDDDRAVVVLRSTRTALELAIDLQRRAASKGVPLALGIDIGEISITDNIPQGRALLKAARIASLASVGEILCSAVVRDVAEVEPGAELWFENRGETELRGLPGSHELVAVRWSASTRAPLRVVVADDSVLLRDGLAALLRERGVDVVGLAADGFELVKHVELHQPDVAIVDIRMPPTHTNEGLVAAEQIRHAQPHVGVLILSQHVDPTYAARISGAGLARTGYLLKERLTDIDLLLNALHRIADGGCVVDPSLADAMMRTAEDRGALPDLTPRERDVLSLVAEGLSNRGIAERLVVTERTVETHVSQIFRKLRLDDGGHEHRRVAAVLAYLRSSEPPSAPGTPSR